MGNEKYGVYTLSSGAIIDFFSFLFSVPENTKGRRKVTLLENRCLKTGTGNVTLSPDFFLFKGSTITAKDCEQLSRKFFFVTCPSGDTCHKCTNAFTHLAKAVVPIKYTTLNAHNKMEMVKTHIISPFLVSRRRKKILGNLLTYPPLDFFFLLGGKLFSGNFLGGVEGVRGYSKKIRDLLVIPLFAPAFMNPQNRDFFPYFGEAKKQQQGAGIGVC